MTETSVSTPASEGAEMPLEDRVRANTYRLLGSLLTRPADAAILSMLGGIDMDENAQDNAMAAAWKTLSLAAVRADIDAVDDEYHALFIGVARGELVPYASWYLTGLMMERPLAQLRQDLKEFGFDRQEDVKEPEDHAGAICEVMSLLIENQAEVSPHRQKRFFDEHIASWMEKFFKDLRNAEAASFYSTVGALGEQFLSIDRQYLEMLPH